MGNILDKAASTRIWPKESKWTVSFSTIYVFLHFTEERETLWLPCCLRNTKQIFALTGYLIIFIPARMLLAQFRTAGEKSPHQLRRQFLGWDEHEDGFGLIVSSLSGARISYMWATSPSNNTRGSILLNRLVSDLFLCSTSWNLVLYANNGRLVNF